MTAMPISEQKTDLETLAAVIARSPIVVAARPARPIDVVSGIDLGQTATQF